MDILGRRVDTGGGGVSGEFAVCDMEMLLIRAKQRKKRYTLVPAAA